MSDITELERRVSAALSRIDRALDAMPGPAAEDPALHEALESERAANAQLMERVRAIKEKQEIILSALERKVAHLTASLTPHRAILWQKAVNVIDSETNRMLNDALRDGARRRAGPRQCRDGKRTGRPARRPCRGTGRDRGDHG